MIETFYGPHCGFAWISVVCMDDKRTYSFMRGEQQYAIVGNTGSWYHVPYIENQGLELFGPYLYHQALALARLFE